MEDVISKLPDDILVSIITRFPTKEAVQTSIISKRWRGVYKLVPTVNFSCDNLAAEKAITRQLHNRDHNIALHPFPPHDSEQIITRLHRFLQLHDSSRPFRSFTCHCCLTKQHEQVFEEFIRSLGKTGTKNLFLSFCCKPLHSDLSYETRFFALTPSLKYLKLMLCSLQPSLDDHHHLHHRNYSIKTLVLSRVKLVPGSLDCLLSNCLSLESVALDRCEFLNCDKKQLRLRGGPDLRLKSLLIYDVGKGVEHVELHACNLTTFEFTNPNMVNFVFDHVPKLQNVYLFIFEENVTSYACGGRLGNDLPHLKSLIFTVDDEYFLNDNIVPPMLSVNVLHKLEKLELNLCCTRSRIDLLITLTPLLHSWPFLQEFHLATLELEGKNNVAAHEERVVLLHSQLKRVYISGFGGTRNEMNLALYIVRSAMVLQKLHISAHARQYFGNGRWSDRERPALKRKKCRYLRNMLRRRAISKTADVVIQLASPRKRGKILISEEDQDDDLELY